MKNRTVLGWTMYDWANSAFATTIMAVILPIYYTDVAAGHLSDEKATAYWGFTQSIAMIIIALLAPFLGAVADYSRSKKKFLTFFIFLGAFSTIFLYFVSEGDYLLASFLFILGMMGFSGANVFYDGFLPEIVPTEEMDYVSSKGYALGYLGGGLLLLINLTMIMQPELFHIKDGTQASRISFVTVGIWWIVFSIPFFVHVREDQTGMKREALRRSYAKISVQRVTSTFKEITKYKQLLKFLIAFWFYNDGINTIIKMATIYGREIGIDKNDLIIALLVTQFVAFPFSLLVGKLARKIGSKQTLYITLWVYVAITILGYFMQTAAHFYALAVAVGLVQGGSQAISRSIFASMVPKKKTAEFFGFFSISSKFASLFGPLLFGFVALNTGSSRNAIFSLIIFFIVGI